MLYLISFQSLRMSACFLLAMAVRRISTVHHKVQRGHGVLPPGITELGNGHIVYVKVS